MERAADPRGMGRRPPGATPPEGAKPPGHPPRLPTRSPRRDRLRAGRAAALFESRPAVPGAAAGPPPARRPAPWTPPPEDPTGLAATAPRAPPSRDRVPSRGATTCDVTRANLEFSNPSGEKRKKKYILTRLLRARRRDGPVFGAPQIRRAFFSPSAGDACAPARPLDTRESRGESRGDVLPGKNRLVAGIRRRGISRDAVSGETRRRRRAAR